jgi:hypothetical protein
LNPVFLNQNLLHQPVDGHLASSTSTTSSPMSPTAGSTRTQGSSQSPDVAPRTRRPQRSVWCAVPIPMPKAYSGGDGIV